MNHEISIGSYNIDILKDWKSQLWELWVAHVRPQWEIDIWIVNRENEN